MITEITLKVKDGINLTRDETTAIFDEIMSGKVGTEELAEFLKALANKGETIDEIVGAVNSMKKVVSTVEPLVNEPLLDIVGTGGDKKSSINVSTASAIVCAGAGCKVAKHGNRSVSSSSGSADVLESLGVKIELNNLQNKKLIEEIGIAFMFARTHHPAMKYAAQARANLGIRTIFNLVGPLTNPAGAKTILLGVYDGKLAAKFAQVLKELEIDALVVHGNDGFDEITVCDSTKIFEVKNGEVKEYVVSPTDYGFELAKEASLLVSDANDSAKKIKSVFDGLKGPLRNVIVMNAGAGIYINGKAKSIGEGIKMAQESIDSGNAKSKLNELIEHSNKV